MVGLLDRNTIADVILTHMHYDHVGTFHRFPQGAVSFLQETEAALHDRAITCAHPFLAHSFEVEDAWSASCG